MKESNAEYIIELLLAKIESLHRKIERLKRQLEVVSTYDPDESLHLKTLTENE